MTGTEVPSATERASATAGAAPSATTEATATTPLPTKPVEGGSAKELIAYIGEDLNVWVVFTDGTGARQLTTDGSTAAPPSAAEVAYRGPVWSADGRTLYVARVTSAGSALFATDLASLSVAALASVEHEVVALAVFPNDRTLGYVYTAPPARIVEEEYHHSACYGLLDIFSGAVTCVPSEDRCDVRARPQFTPDGRSLAVGWRDFEWWGTELRGLDGSNPVNLPSVEYCYAIDYAHGGAVLWAVCADNWPPKTSVLMRVDLRNDQATIVGRVSAGIYEIDLSPDGASAVVEDGDTIRILDLRTKDTREIARGSQPAWQPVGISPGEDE
jgi:hypothetical protein